MTNLDRFARVTRLLAEETRVSIGRGELNGLLAGIIEGLAIAVITRADADREAVSDLVDISCNQLTEVCAEKLLCLDRAAVPQSMLDRFRRILEGRTF